MEKIKHALGTFARRFACGFRARWWYMLVIAGVIAFDQFTKYLTVSLLEYKESFPLWEDVFHFTYTRNRGAAFGMLADNRWVFMVVSVVGILAFFCYLYGKAERDLLLDLGVAFIIGGGIGNMIDRTVLGYVIDFLDFTLIDFAVFNVADSFVCVGGGMLILALILQIIKEEKKKKQGEHSTESKGDDAPTEGSK